MLGRAVVILAVLFSVALYGRGAGYCSEYNVCFKEASQKYHVSEAILRAIAFVESGMNPMAVNKNANGSEDLGLMQINSVWLPYLAKYGVERKDLFDPCISIRVGAWILANNIATYGATWRAVGAYNAASEAKRFTYARKVAAAMKTKEISRESRYRKTSRLRVLGAIPWQEETNG